MRTRQQIQACTATHGKEGWGNTRATRKRKTVTALS